MSDPKARSTPAVEKTDKRDDTTRFLNLGIPVKLSFGEYTVRELDVVSLGLLATNGLDVLVQLQQSEGDGTGSDFALISRVLMNPDGRDIIARIFSFYCGEEDPTPFRSLKPRDFNTLWKAVKEVTDFEEIKETFFVLGLQKYLPILPTSTDQEEPANPAG